MTGARYPLGSCVGDNQRRVNGAASSGHEERPRPVADAPIDGLLESADELAKRWVLALLRARPLEEIARFPLAEIAALAPALCASVLRALRFDDALELEDQAGSSAAGDPLGAGREFLRLPWHDGPRELVTAVEALRSVLWDSLVRAAGATSLAAPSDRLLSDLADRLAHVCSVVLTRSLPGRAAAPAHVPSGRTDSAIPRESPRAMDTAIAGEPAQRAPTPAQGSRAAWRRAPTVAGASAASSRVVLVDEFSEPATGARGPEERGARRATDAPSMFTKTSQEALRADARPLPWDIPLGDTETQDERTAGEGPKRRKADVPSISIIRRRRPRERE